MRRSGRRQPRTKGSCPEPRGRARQRRASPGRRTRIRREGWPRRSRPASASRAPRARRPRELDHPTPLVNASASPPQQGRPSTFGSPAQLRSWAEPPGAIGFASAKGSCGPARGQLDPETGVGVTRWPISDRHGSSEARRDGGEPHRVTPKAFAAGTSIPRAPAIFLVFPAKRGDHSRKQSARRV
jgi:hypothetical protein